MASLWPKTDLHIIAPQLTGNGAVYSRIQKMTLDTGVELNVPVMPRTSTLDVTLHMTETELSGISKGHICRLITSFSDASVDDVIYKGYIDDIDIRHQHGYYVVSLDIVGAMGRFFGYNWPSGMGAVDYKDKRSLLLQAMRLMAVDYDVDALPYLGRQITNAPTHRDWADGNTAAISREIIQSAIPPVFLFERGDGETVAVGQAYLLQQKAYGINRIDDSVYRRGSFEFVGDSINSVTDFEFGGYWPVGSSLTATLTANLALRSAVPNRGSYRELDIRDGLIIARATINDPATHYVKADSLTIGGTASYTYWEYRFGSYFGPYNALSQFNVYFEVGEPYIIERLNQWYIELPLIRKLIPLTKPLFSPNTPPAVYLRYGWSSGNPVKQTDASQIYNVAGLPSTPYRGIDNDALYYDNKALADYYGPKYRYGVKRRVLSITADSQSYAPYPGGIKTLGRVELAEPGSNVYHAYCVKQAKWQWSIGAAPPVLTLTLDNDLLA